MPQLDNHYFDTRVKESGENRVVPTERMTDRADAFGLHLGKRLEQVDSTHVIPNRLESSTLPSQGIEVRLVLRQQRIIGGEGHEASLRQLGRVLTIRFIS